MNVEMIYKEDIKYDIFPDECVKMESETTSKKSKNKMKKERWILKSDNQLVSEYATHFWMRASGSEHIKMILTPMNVESIWDSL